MQTNTMNEQPETFQQQKGEYGRDDYYGADDADEEEDSDDKKMTMKKVMMKMAIVKSTPK